MLSICSLGHLGCATGSRDEGGHQVAPDASRGLTLPDADVPGEVPDAAKLLADAAPDPDQDPDPAMPAADAGALDLFCQSNSECGAPGECCFFLAEPPGFCTPGQELGDLCLPE